MECLWQLSTLFLVALVVMVVWPTSSNAFPLLQSQFHHPSFVSSSSRLWASSTSTADEEKKTAVLICPAQFCVPADYEDLANLLKEKHPSTISSVVVTPLPRTEWIKVAKQLPTKDFLDANLSCQKTLGWYFDAMEEALSQIFAQEGTTDINICIIGHSIGGWVARAYLGGLSGSSSAVYKLAQPQITSFLTLGTPHLSPEDALVDQTRGLLKEVEQTSSCSSQSLIVDRNIDVTNVISSGLQGKILTTNLEEIVATTSYLPLLGKLGDRGGDGIIPVDLAFMEEPARRITIESCPQTKSPVRHAHVLPTPWNLWDGQAPSISLPDDFIWYGSESVIDQWSKYIR